LIPVPKKLDFALREVGQASLDCIGLSPQNVAIQQIQNRWKVVDGSNWLLDYGSDKAGAERARDAIRHYGLTKECFIGRPNPSMTYWLVGTQPPSGALIGEDCIPFTPSRLVIANIMGRWFLLEGKMSLLAFDFSQVEAKGALSVIQRYDFRYQCFVGRPNAQMTYWRR
jgi:hypothetical protein